MDRLIIESLLIFVITYLIFELLNKYIEVDRLIILILSVVISAIYYMKRSGYEHLENTGENTGENPNDPKPDETPAEDPKPDKTSDNDPKPDNNPAENPTSDDPKSDNTSDNSSNSKPEEPTKDLTITQTGDGTTPNKLEIKDQNVKVDGNLTITQSNNTSKETEKDTTEPTKEPEQTQPKTVLEQTNEAGFKVNNVNNDGTLNYFSDKNIQRIKKGKAYDDTFTDHVENNISKQDTRNQFQTDDNIFNVNGHSNIPEKLEDIGIEGLKDPDVITNENQYTQYGGYIDANTLYVPRDYQYTDDDYGWNFIPPLKWIDLPDQNAPRVPLCVSANGNCKVNASLTSGYPITVKTWNESRKVMGPSHIDVEYIKNHLNTAKPPVSIKS